MAETIWDALVPVYEKWAEPTSAAFAEAALDRAELCAASAVLDVAAGTGALAVAAAARGHGVHAIDNSPGMVSRLTERLESYPGSSAQLMDALDLQYGDDEFDAAFSMLGVLYFGPMAVKALTEMVRVVRPGGVVGVVHWASPVGGGPMFVPLVRALDRLGDPEARGLTIPVTNEFLEGGDVEHVLGEAGCVDVWSEKVERESPMPTPETFMDELDLFFQMFPQYRTAVSRHRDRLREALAEEVRLMAKGKDGHPLAQVNIAYGRVPR
ncbi:hypothetical protein GCM10010372_76220 [Streptomyces tauricus]|uniref:class I SAM-dependent methyltransferase n=1 Tax=Streptomyces tauricus TaxID=68274 RepID=UPI00167BCDC5|nr:class I SAM-dependent methyltransferase [Streptomyces tauricus]GHA65194.1 hypothetical protein GCM10010372_76220 [Streptomyces tauricus]